jgi:hypothetical protein
MEADLVDLILHNIFLSLTILSFVSAISLSYPPSRNGKKEFGFIPHGLQQQQHY